MPGTPQPSMGMEHYNDTPIVNGTAYPVLNVDPKSYRLRILNAANDRFFNLQMYVADGSVVTDDGRRNTEVKMIPAQVPSSRQLRHDRRLPLLQLQEGRPLLHRFRGREGQRHAEATAATYKYEGVAYSFDRLEPRTTTRRSTASTTE